MSIVENINRQTWRNPLERRIYRQLQGFIDRGEEIVFNLGLAAGTGGRVLDVGVGGGRTAEILAPRSSTYAGIDYTAEMIFLSRKRCPSLRFDVMDARDLSAFADGAFDLVVFSNNGIDSVEGEGRLQILNEIARVLRPGGCFVFSTFNRAWNGFGEKRVAPSVTWTTDPLRLGYRLSMRLLAWFRRHRYRRFEVQGEHAAFLHHAHNFGIMVYATTPDQLRRQLSASGFETGFELFSPKGEALNPDLLHADTEYFHVFAKRREA